MIYDNEFKKTKEYKNILENNKKWYTANKEKRKKQMLKNYNNNKEKMSKYKKTYYEKNKDHVKAKAKEYRDNNKEKIRISRQEYWKRNKDKLAPINAARNKEIYYTRTDKDKEDFRAKKRIYEKNKRKTDPQYAIKKRLRLRVWQTLKGIKKGHSDEYGIHYDKILDKMTKTIPKDYINNPSKYEIDHIIPLSSFNLRDIKEVKKAFAPENHQWLTASENSRKKDLSPEEWNSQKQKGLYSKESNDNIMLKKITPTSIKPAKIKKAKRIRPTDINPSYSYIAGDPKKNERINFKHWNDLLFGKDDDKDTTYSNLWLYRNPQKVEPFRDDIGSPSKTQAQKLGKKYYSEFNPLVAENIINFWSDENNIVLDPFAGRIRGIVAGLKHRHYIGFEISPEAHKSILNVIDDGKEQFDDTFTPIIHCDDSMNISKYNVPKVDMIFSCPPYHNLEEYESIPGQLSDIKDHDEFLTQMKKIMGLSLEKLKDNGFCVLVVGDYRIKDKLINFDYETVKMMEELGIQLWDKVILQNITFGWAGIKFGHTKHKRITSKVTEYLLVFKKIPKTYKNQKV